jgi:hypothetical protein
MIREEDPRLPEARARPIWDIVQALDIQGLRRGAAREWVGPCPECGGDDRFSIHTGKGVYYCRHCDARGDVIELVRWLRKMTLAQALDWLCGPLDTGLSETERRARREKAEANRQKAARDADRYRAEAVAQARKVWREAGPAEDSPVRAYLDRRGISREVLPAMPRCLRFHPALRYMVHGAAGWREVWRGPAMVAAIQRADGQGSAVHRTWLDLSRPKGKAEVVDPVTGEVLDAKKSLGSKKGGVIRLLTPLGPWSVLVVGEGIETTLSALAAGLHAGAAFWSAVDLGNLSGKRQTGRGLKFAGLPDMEDDEAFVPPANVRHLVLVEDGDSDPRDTRAKLLAGARRAMARIPGLTAEIVPCPAGYDLNDVLLGKAVE